MKKLLLLFFTVLFTLNMYAQSEPTTYSASVIFSLLPEGAINGLFSVSSTKQVYIAKGNLQWQGSTNTWRFAEHQYDCLMNGAGNTAPSESQTAWKDLFGYGTSGYNNISPARNVDNNASYRSADIAGTNYDWGVYNAISNGGNQAGLWRTLTGAEFYYIFKTRTNASSKYGLATVNGRSGVVILPDSWTLPSGCSFNSGTSSFSLNTYTIALWDLMESAGAVFLPFAGFLVTTNWYDTQSLYFTSTLYSGDTDRANGLVYTVSSNQFAVPTTTNGKAQKRTGSAVRLVKDYVNNNNSLSYSIKNISQGSITVSKDGDNYIVTAVPASGYAFYKWVDNNSTNPVRTVCCISEAETYTAQFVRQYAVTFSSASDSIAYVIQGSSIASMPVRTPASGYAFVGWATTENALAPDIVFPYTPTDDIVVYPVWQLIISINVTDNTTTSTLPVSLAGAPYADVYIANGAVLTVTETSVGSQFNFRSITVKAGGRLVIPSGTYISTSKLVMEGGDADASDNYLYRYPQLVANGTLNVSGNVIYYDCLLNKRQQYLFCLPGNVNVADITYADGSPAVLGTNYKVACYNGAARAKGELGWEYIPNNTTTLTAGKGYTIFVNPQYYQFGGTGSVMQHAYSRLRFPIAITANYTEAAKTVPVSAYPSLTGRDNDAGWNFIGNPYFADFSNNSLGLSYQASDGIGLLTLNGSGGFDWTGNQRYVVHISDDGKSYYSELATAATLSTFKSLFVQIGANDAAALSFPIANRRQNMLAKNVEEDILMTGVTLSQSANTANVDRLGVLVGDNFTDAYEINADLQKLGHNAGVNLYAWMRSSELAFVAVNEAYAANAIPVGFIAPQAGEYTFSLDGRYDSSMFSAVVLYDSETRQSADLLSSNYKFSVSKAQTNNTRFTLSLNVRADMPTAIGNVAALEQGQVDKSLINGNLVIRANGLVYNAQGAVLK